MRVKRDAFVKQSVGSYVPSMFLGTRDMAVNKTDEILALMNLYYKERVNEGEKRTKFKREVKKW